MNRYYYRTTDLDYPLACVHYSDSNFKGEGAVIFGEMTGKHNEYADRLWQWDHEKSEKCFKQAKQEFPCQLPSQTNARAIQRYLSLYFDKEIILRGIIAGVSPCDGCSWHCFNFDEIEQNEAESTGQID